MAKPNYAFLGSTNFSKKLLLFLIKNDFIPKIIFYIPKNYKIKINKEEKEKINVNYSDLTKIAKNFNIPCFEVNSIKGKRLIDYKKIIEKLSLDFLIALGWYYMIPEEIRKITKYGAWGIHASLLPKYAGGAPLVWAIINGEKKTGVTLFKMDDGIDDGDIIIQKEFEINFNDDIKTIYEKATFFSKKILLDAFKKFPKIEFIPQDKNKIAIYPQRDHNDGVINWSNNAMNIYNFIRAQTLPYPCAFSFIGKTCVKFLNSKITSIESFSHTPGKIVNYKNKPVIATKDFFLEIGEVIIEKKYKFHDFIKKNNLFGKVFKSKPIDNF